MQKEVLKTHVTQETIPVHEKIYDAPEVAELKTKPPITEEEFNRMRSAHVQREEWLTTT